MPEGDTIFRAARTLDLALGGHVVTAFRTVLPQLARVDDDAPVAGRRIERVRSAGKHLLMTFSGDLILRTHMRMHGSWHVYRPGERWQAPARDMRILVGTAAFEAVAFRVPVAEFRTQAALNRDPALRDLGPDLLAPDFDAAGVLQRLCGLGQVAIADALLMQRVVAGIGNVFKSEILFEARLSPFRPVGDVPGDRLAGLLAIARRQLRASVDDEDIARADAPWRRTTGRLNPDERLWVYGRAGRPCLCCGTTVRRARQGGDARITYYCPTCQETGP